MFGFKKKKDTEISEWDRITKLHNSYLEKEKRFWDWHESDEYKRFAHLQTLILKTFETVKIKIDLSGSRIDPSYTRDDFLEDFRVFFKPEVFNKLSDWCKEYETLRDKESKILENL